MDLSVVNHEDYFAKIGDDHKFPINKFGELANYLIKKNIVKNFHKPYLCSEETLKRAHSKNYIKNIKNKTLDKNVVKKIGFPLVDSVVQRSLVATGGTVLAAKLAIKYAPDRFQLLNELYERSFNFAASSDNDGVSLRIQPTALNLA